MSAFQEYGQTPSYLYTVACHEDEFELCRLEMRTMLGSEPEENGVISGKNVDPSRSPFIKYKIAIRYEGATTEELAEQAGAIELGGRTFKVVFVETDGGIPYGEQRGIERRIGMQIPGKAEMRKPEAVFGIARIRGRWVFGECRQGEAVWLKHKQKPQPYSTALGTRVARAVVNIAVPEPEGVRVVDPCCGIGTVIIEALSMGMNIEGFDLNPLAVRGARVNLAHYGMPDVVRIADIRSLEGNYDTAIVDLPYNLCSVMPPEERLDMLSSARRLARRIVIITTEVIDDDVDQAGLVIRDRCAVRKGRFERQVLVCSPSEA
ncbi:TRM11 family SAM-dependent methyltransferase [Paenibacillus spongiae]|uniref:RsmD family RNA methyltransferase n=1 Tax=Paenibacillus spongiae TaxID=2909671 RepID=A0ABY5SEX4_9BACL|nr:RsmD family RNA methyltransferase [Paenibacillus spongiae]UVI30823.1 RsmD family RNA methyltransferase [Paenibacillus spongiae]